MISAPGFTQRDQVARVKFQLRMKVERFDMVDLQLVAFVATDHTCRLAEAMFFCHSGPLWTSFMPMLSSYVRSVIHSLSHDVLLFESPFLRMVCLPSQSQECDSYDKHNNHY